jgi:hypothetical protein
MRGPWRPLSHIRETASFKAITNCFPDTWEPRHVSGRDYGVDCIVEMSETKDGKTSMPGALFSVQAKGVGRLAWRKDGVARVHGIKRSTVSYWMKLPMPVFLCVHEAKSGNVYVADVKSYVRRHYGELFGKRRFSFEVDRNLPLNTEPGLAILVYLFLREMSFPDFAHSLKFLLTQEQTFDMLQAQQRAKNAADEADELSIARLTTFMNACRRVADYLGLEWAGPSFNQVVAHDPNRRLDDGISEGSIAWGYGALDSHYRRLVQAGKKLVTEVERQFWVLDDPFLVRGCFSEEQRASRRAWRESEEAKLLEARALKELQLRQQRRDSRAGGPEGED